MQIGFIGTGKIAAAIIEGICTSAIKDAVIYLSPRNEDIATKLTGDYANVHRLQSNQAVADASGIIFISLTPANAQQALTELVFNSRHIIISLIPLFRYDALSALVFPATQICRAIPLPAVRVHNCPVPVFKANNMVIELFSYIGQPLIVDNERDLHILWSLTGLVSPFYDQLAALGDWAVAHGADKSTASQYIVNLYQSLATVAQRSHPLDFALLSEHAATPKGMNEQAAKELKEQQAHQLYKHAAEHLLKRFE